MVPPWLVRLDVPLHILNCLDVEWYRWFSKVDIERREALMSIVIFRWSRYTEDDGTFVGLFT
jgi:hypothetical protein